MGFLRPPPSATHEPPYFVPSKVKTGTLTHVKRWLSFIKQHLNTCDHIFSIVSNCGSSTQFNSCLRFTVDFGFQNATYPKLSDFFHYSSTCPIFFLYA